VPAQLADVPITIEILPEAQRMVDEANERRVAEHGFLADNPLLDEILFTIYSNLEALAIRGEGSHRSARSEATSTRTSSSTGRRSPTRSSGASARRWMAT
jgi:hypothetical protein